MELIAIRLDFSRKCAGHGMALRRWLLPIPSECCFVCHLLLQAAAHEIALRQPGQWRPTRPPNAWRFRRGTSSLGVFVAGDTIPNRSAKPLRRCSRRPAQGRAAWGCRPCAATACRYAISASGSTRPRAGPTGCAPLLTSAEPSLLGACSAIYRKIPVSTGEDEPEGRQRTRTLVQDRILR